MENASKALIIAGAILLAILLISLGIMIFNQAQTVVNGSGMTEAEITTFNSKFQKYEGSQKGSVVKSLINDILAVNSDDNDENDISAGEDSTDITSTSWINTSTTYSVEFGYENGRISSVTIK
ncbi:MAG: hypothetical protein ACI4VH_00460 [Clostridia bacterium]